MPKARMVSSGSIALSGEIMVVCRLRASASGVPCRGAVSAHRAFCGYVNAQTNPNGEARHAPNDVNNMAR